jgi:hypothetical protein
MAATAIARCSFGFPALKTVPFGQHGNPAGTINITYK